MSSKKWGINLAKVKLKFKIDLSLGFVQVERYKNKSILRILSILLSQITNRFILSSLFPFDSSSSSSVVVSSLTQSIITMMQSCRVVLQPTTGIRMHRHLVLRNKSFVPTRVARGTTTVSTVASGLISSAKSSSRPRLGRRLWDAYLKSLSERPLLTKASFAATIFFCSDSATQYILCNDKELFRWDAPRALSGASFGIVATGWLHYWWGFLEAVVARRLPVATHRLANSLTKVLLDQAIGAPAYIYTYYVLTNFLKEQLSGTSQKSWQQSWKETNTHAKELLWPTMLQHWRVWIPVHSCNFYFMPLQHRVMVQNTVLTFWSGYLSHLNHKSQIMTPDEEIKATIVRRESVKIMEIERPAVVAAAAPSVVLSKRTATTSA
jgi:protein Mpv17